MHLFMDISTFTFINVDLITDENGPGFDCMLEGILALVHNGKITESLPVHLSF